MPINPPSMTCAWSCPTTKRGGSVFVLVRIPMTVALRDLGHSAPYFHGGHVDTLDVAVQHYRASGLSSRFGLVRNVAPEVLGIEFEVDDLLALVAFLRALYEDPP